MRNLPTEERSQLGALDREGSPGSCVDGPPLARTFLKLRHIAGRCGHVSGLFMRPYHVPLAIMLFARLRSQSIPRTRSARPTVGFPEPAVSTGFVHSLLFALPNLSGAYKAPILCRDQICKDRFAIAFSARHQRPDYARQFISQGNCRDFRRAARHQLNEPRAARSMPFGIADHRHRPHHKHLPEIAVSSFCNTAKPLLSSA